MLQNKQYTGHGTEDLHQHMQLFDKIYEKFKLSDFAYDEMELKLCGQILTAKAKAWLYVHPAETFDTRENNLVRSLVIFFQRRNLIERDA